MQRKYITIEQFESLKPFNKMASVAEKITGLSSKEYWFQICIEVTVECDRHEFATIESHKR